MTVYFLILVLGLLAGCLSGVIGMGSSIVLLPILVYQFGPQQAVPIMAIAGLMSNIGKVWAWRREVDWRAFAVFAAAAVPAAAFGAHTLLVLRPNVVEFALGLFFIVMIPVRRWLQARDLAIRAWQLSLSGAVIGFLTGVVLSTGPLMIPAFAAYGLLKGALLSTEAMASLAVTVTKLATFGALNALPWDLVLKGLAIGASVMAGTFLGKAVVQRMSVDMFHLILDAVMLISGLSMLWAAFR